MKTFSEAEIADWIAVSRIMAEGAPNHELIDRLFQCLDIIAQLQAENARLVASRALLLEAVGIANDAMPTSSVTARMKIAQLLLRSKAEIEGKVQP